MPTTTQAQIDEARKRGFSQAQIDALMQRTGATIAPAPALPTNVTTPTPITPSPVPWSTMDTSTGAPYIAPTPPIMNWETIGKQKDPTQVSSYLNTQPWFKTTVSGNTVTGTKNWVQTTWVYDGANWVAKPTIATSETPVIGTPPATTPTTTTTDFTTMTPEQLKARYMEIGTKLPWEVTDEDRKFTRYLQTRMSLGETPDVIFGTKGTKSSGTTAYSTELVQPWENIASSVRNSDGTYKVTYKDWTTQITTSEPSTTVFPEWTPEYFAQKQAQEANKRLQVLEEQLNAEAERRKKETADLVAKYGENIATQFQNQKAEIEANGAKRMDALNTGLSFSGFGRSTLAIEKRDEIAKNIETTINQAKAKADLELMAYRMEREGADAEAIATMRTNIANVQQKIDDANYANQLKIIELNQQNATTGAEAMNNLLATISDSEEIVSNADLEKSQMLGYFVNKDGSIMLDSQKRPIQFEGNPWNLDPSAIGAYADALSKGIIDEKWLDKLSPSDKAAVLKHVSVQNNTYVPPAQWSGELIMTKIGNKTVKVDTVALPWLQAAMASMPEWAYLGSTFRTYEEQAKLYEAYKSGNGWLAAPPWTSRHEKGMAVDLYAPGGKDPTPEMVAIMKANGWRQWSGNWPLPWDAGHFEYVGTNGEGGQADISNLSKEAQSIIAQINSQWGKPTDYILGTSKDSQALLQEVLQWLNAQWGTGTLAADTRKQSLDLAQKTIDQLLTDKDIAGSFRVRNEWTNLTANKYTNLQNRVDALAGQLLQIDWPTLKAMFWPQISNSDVEAIKRTILQGVDAKQQTPAEFEKSLKDVKAKMQAYINRLPQNQWTATMWDANGNWII